jgi:hypothetical protein
MPFCIPRSCKTGSVRGFLARQLSLIPIYLLPTAAAMVIALVLNRLAKQPD